MARGGGLEMVLIIVPMHKVSGDLEGGETWVWLLNGRKIRACVRRIG